MTFISTSLDSFVEKTSFARFASLDTSREGFLLDPSLHLFFLISRYIYFGYGADTHTTTITVAARVGEW
jgi:hypothetical protein